MNAFFLEKLQTYINVIYKQPELHRIVRFP